MLIANDHKIVVVFFFPDSLPSSFCLDRDLSEHFWNKLSIHPTQALLTHCRGFLIFVRLLRSVTAAGFPLYQYSLSHTRPVRKSRDDLIGIPVLPWINFSQRLETDTAELPTSNHTNFSDFPKLTAAARLHRDGKATSFPECAAILLRGDRITHSDTMYGNARCHLFP